MIFDQIRTREQAHAYKDVEIKNSSKEFQRMKAISPALFHTKVRTTCDATTAGVRPDIIQVFGTTDSPP